jgi:hypothetical protein
LTVKDQLNSLLHHHHHHHLSNAYRARSNAIAPIAGLPTATNSHGKPWLFGSNRWLLPFDFSHQKPPRATDSHGKPWLLVSHFC